MFHFKFNFFIFKPFLLYFLVLLFIVDTFYVQNVLLCDPISDVNDPDAIFVENVNETVVNDNHVDNVNEKGDNVNEKGDNNVGDHIHSFKDSLKLRFVWGLWKSESGQFSSFKNFKNSRRANFSMRNEVKMDIKDDLKRLRVQRRTLHTFLHGGDIKK